MHAVAKKSLRPVSRFSGDAKLKKRKERVCVCVFHNNNKKKKEYVRGGCLLVHGQARAAPFYVMKTLAFFTYAVNIVQCKIMNDAVYTVDFVDKRR
jgi:hypothetical protein